MFIFLYIKDVLTVQGVPKISKSKLISITVTQFKIHLKYLYLCVKIYIRRQGRKIAFELSYIVSSGSYINPKESISSWSKRPPYAIYSDFWIFHMMDNTLAIYEVSKLGVVICKVFNLLAHKVNLAPVSSASCDIDTNGTLVNTYYMTAW